MADTPHSTIARLRTQAANVDGAIADLEAIVDSAEDGVARLRAAPHDIFTLMGAGGLLHGFYSTLEGLLRDVAESLNGFVPSGPDWHARLLEQMSRDVPGVLSLVKTRSGRQREHLGAHDVPADGYAIDPGVPERR